MNLQNITLNSFDESYNATFLNRHNRGGGKAVYIKEHIPFKIIATNTQYFETIKIEVMKTYKQSITILAIYRPPNQNPNSFLEELEQCINIVNKK